MLHFLKTSSRFDLPAILEISPQSIMTPYVFSSTKELSTVKNCFSPSINNSSSLISKPPSSASSIKIFTFLPIEESARANDDRIDNDTVADCNADDE